MARKRRPTKVVCVKCEQEKKPSKQDDAFCQDCHDEIEDKYRRPMLHARAAAALVNGMVEGPARDRTKMAAFLAIFHPRMPESVARSLINDAGRA